jgi:uncharacterized protein YciI
MTLYAVTYTYTYAADSDAARDAHRPDHVAFLRGLKESGRLQVSGPLSEGPAGALLVIEGQSAEGVSSLMDGDPFRQAGLVEDRTVRRWDPYFGGTLAGKE